VDRRRAARRHGRPLLTVGRRAAVEGLAAGCDAACRRLPRHHVRRLGHPPAPGMRRVLQRDRRRQRGLRPAGAAPDLRARAGARLQPAPTRGRRTSPTRGSRSATTAASAICRG
jgi:hypothetical protein